MDHLGPDVPLHFTAFHPEWSPTDQTADTAADPAHGAADRHERRPSLCLYRQCSRSRRPGHALSRMRRGADWPRLCTTSQRGICLRTVDVPSVIRAAMVCLKPWLANGVRAVSQ